MNRNLIVISLILVLVSCKKEKPTNNSLSEKMQLLTSQEWVAQKVEERKGNGP